MKSIEIAAGLLAAAFWLASALVPIPRSVWRDAGLGGGQKSSDVDKLVAGLRWQSTLSAAGAFCAAVAVLIESGG